MPSKSRVYQATMNEHRRRLARVVDRGSVPQLRKLYDDAGKFAAKAAGGKPWEGSSAKGYSKELWNEFRFEEAHKYLTPALEKHGIRVAIVPAGHRPQA